MQESQPSDAQLVQRSLAGDRSAFSSLVRRHQRALHRFLLRMVGSHDEALELTQETFVRAWQALPQWLPDAKFNTWLFRIGSNAALDVLRRRAAVEIVPIENAVEAVHPGAGPERQVQLRQEVRQLEATLSRLSPEHRQILLLREVEDMAYQEIAQVLSVSEGTVKSRLARARTALIEHLRQDAT